MGLTDPTADSALLRFVQLRCIVGSTAQGLATQTSDVDRRGFYLPPARLHWSLAGVPEQLQTANEEVYWEIEKFIRMALKATPNVLECLYSPSVEKVEPIAQRFLDHRDVFLSQQLYQSYSAYAESQFKKIENDLRTRGAIRWKHVMHLLRSLLSGIAYIRQDSAPVQMDRHREALLAIRRGEVAWAEAERWRLSLQREFSRAIEQTKLPSQPDYQAANQLLLEARAYAASETYDRT